MKTISSKLGYYSAWISIACFITWIICFIAIYRSNQDLLWSNLENYIRNVKAFNQTWKYIAQFAMMLFPVFFLVMTNSVHQFSSDTMKPLSRLALCFAAMFALCAGMHYFVQISAVRLSIEKNQLAGLEQFVQANPTSGMAAINMLGWSLFLGLSSLFIAPVLKGSKAAKTARIAFIANGLICITGGVAYVFDNIVIIFLCMNIGMGGALLVAIIALLSVFRSDQILGKEA
jgi:hypothetical protein